MGRPLNTSGLEKLIRDSIRKTLEADGYEWKQMYAGRRGAVTEVNRHPKGNVQIAAPLFGNTPEVEASNYGKEIPEETRATALALDAALQGTTEGQSFGMAAK